MHTLSVERLHSKKDIKLAGLLLSGQVQKTPEIENAFRIVHNWRSHHAYPMVRERAKLTRLVKAKSGLTAGRLKRMSSIRKKLFIGSTKLDQMQDLVGCRAILENMDDLREVLSKYKTIDKGGRVRRTNNYITNPKHSGYRSVHLVVKFGERGTGEKHAGCNVEIQLRTQLQHVWATTVEAAGAMRNEDLKAGEGSAGWLRFLSLMSGYISELEAQPRGEHLQMSYKDLTDEARDLSESLNVRENLESFSALMREADVYGGFHSSRYMLKMDTDTGNVHVSPAWRELFAFDDLDDDFEESRQSIEVSVDNMTALRQAYPNYFADTRQFLEVLSEMEFAKSAKKTSTIDKLDLSFLPKNPPTFPKKSKALRLDSSGIVFWDGQRVGAWEKGIFGTHFFMPMNESYAAFQSNNLMEFEEDLIYWLEGE